MADLVADLDDQVPLPETGSDTVPDPDGDAVVEPVEDPGPPLVAKVRYSWRDADEDALKRIEYTANQVCRDLFGEALDTIDELYAQMRIRAVNGNTNMALSAPDNRPLWVADPQTGKPIERLDQLTGQDYDTAILRLQTLLLTIAPEVDRLKSDAIYAQHLVARDAFDDGWRAAKGQQGDKRAEANIVAREDRYHSFFRYFVYSRAKTYLDEIRAFVKHLDNIRYRQLREQ